MASRDQSGSRTTTGSQQEQGRGATGGGATEQGRREAGEAERSIPRTEEGGRGQLTRERGGARRPGALLAGFPFAPWEMFRQMEQLMQAVGATGVTPGAAGQRGALQAGPEAGLPGFGMMVPRIEVEQRPNAFVVRADLPGTNADEIEVTAENGMLVISGERREVHREGREGAARSEVVYGRFYRAIPLPDGADENRISATYRNGVLEVEVPISERERARRVQVES